MLGLSYIFSVLLYFRSAVFTGRSYGDGIYLSNAFDKSFGYSNSSNGEPLYLLLCDVTPGKSLKMVSWQDTDRQFPPKNFDSAISVGQNGPSESGKVRLSFSGTNTIKLFLLKYNWCKIYGYF